MRKNCNKRHIIKRLSTILFTLLILLTAVTGCSAEKLPAEKLPTAIPTDEVILTSPERLPLPESPENAAIEPENNPEAGTEEVAVVFTSESVPEPEKESESEPPEEITAQLDPEVLMPVRLIVIDPGHQARANFSREPNGPGSSEMKEKDGGGTAGVATGVPEYKLNLTVSFLLRDELIARGYNVVMTRETNDTDIGNIERANIATEAGADIFVRIHANGSASSSSKGILTISPTANNPFIPSLYTQSRFLSQCLLDEMIAATGANNSGIWETDTMTGINWSTVPVTIVEMGYMTNPDEDKLLQNTEYQMKIVDGIANGIDLYFSTEPV